MAEPTPHESLPKKLKATMAVLGSLAAINTAKGAQQSPTPTAESQPPPPAPTATPTIGETHQAELARISKQRQRPELEPMVEVEVERKIWLELLTKNPEEEKAAEKLIMGDGDEKKDKAKREGQMPRIRSIAIDPVTEGPSTKLQQILLPANRNKIEEEARKHGLPKDITLAIFLTEGWLDDSLTDDAAEEMGIRVDQRNNPSRYIEGMVGYLAKQRDLWGDDMGIVVASFNAGQGTMAQLVYRFAQAHGDKLPKPTDDNFTPEDNPYRAYLQQHTISIYKLLTDPSTASYRSDIAEIYTPRVAAAIKYLVENGKLEKEFVRKKVPASQVLHIPVVASSYQPFKNTRAEV